MVVTKREEELRALGMRSKRDAMAHLRKATKLRLESLDAMRADDVILLDGAFSMMFEFAGFDPAEHDGFPLKCDNCGHVNWPDILAPTHETLKCSECQGMLE